tara:strand:+ start:19 stop:1545 length:1527 start_codon:yes stop_codon:yes gene_type:complete
MSNKFYITTPIYYVNDKPHIGHAYTSIAADCIARFRRLQGYDVRFQTGTDEHGLKIQKAAERNNLTPIELCNKNSKNFRDLTIKLNLSNDDFIRTTETRHKNGAIYLWNLLYKNNQIYEGEYEGWYSVSDETFYNEKDLIKSEGGLMKTATGSSVEWIAEKSYFFRLSEWRDKLLDHYKKNPEFIRPRSKRNEVISFVEKGLNDLSISRTSFNWGINVPSNKDHIMYVWLDALTCYPNGVGYLSENRTEISDFWSNTLHIVGKDILRHHAIYWPAFLMAAKLELPKKIFAHGWWTNEGNKISKSLGNIIDPHEIIDTFGLDQFRYFVLREVPFGNDGDFSIKALKNRINADLSNDLGNLCQRSLTMIEKSYNSTIPSDDNLSKEYSDLINKFDERLLTFIKLIEIEDITSYVKSVWSLISEVNKFFNDKKPWELKNSNEIEYKNILHTTATLIKQIGLFIYPIMPETSEKIFNILKITTDKIDFKSINEINLSKIKINKVLPLFPRVN